MGEDGDATPDALSVTPEPCVGSGFWPGPNGDASAVQREGAYCASLAGEPAAKNHLMAG
jgi:hypothetical protein